MAVDAISVEVGYEDAAFFRRLFKRRTGLRPSEYRRMFQPIAELGGKACRDASVGRQSSAAVLAMLSARSIPVG